MSLKVILIMTVLIASSAFARDWKKLKLINGCRIHNPAGYMERSFPGKMCIFLDDGNLISASDTKIRMLNPKSEVIWEYSGNFHHQMNLSQDGDKILALSSEINEGIREDTFIILNFEGKLLYSQKASEISKLAKVKSLKWPMSPTTINGVSSSVENSHFNSFYDVPTLDKKKLPSWMSKGNIILNSTALGTFILSPDMQKVLYHFTLPGSTHHRLHDVQVKPNGNFLLFNNLVGNKEKALTYLAGPKVTMYHSAIQEIDPVSLNVVEEFSANPKTMFYSWICGSVQEIDEDTWLFTHFLSGTYIYSKSKKDFIASIPGTHADNERFYPNQQVKAQDLTKFLSHWN